MIIVERKLWVNVPSCKRNILTTISRQIRESEAAKKV